MTYLVARLVPDSGREHARHVRTVALLVELAADDFPCQDADRLA